MLTVLIIIAMLVISGGLVALYREVGFGRFGDAPRSDAPSPTTPSFVSPPSRWPFENLSVGRHLAVPTEDAFTGFLALCADDDDAFAAVHSAAVVAEDWGYPLLVGIAKTARPNGWIDRLDGLPGNVGDYDMRVDEMRSLGPVQLPIVAFLNEGRLLDASVALESPSSIATSFHHCRFGLTR
jgi:hypothetical protein